MFFRSRLSRATGHLGHLEHLGHFTGRRSLLSRRAINSSATSWLPVPDRKYIEIAGKDAHKFMQGLVSNDTSLLSKHGDCIACLFLTSKGRVLADAMLYCTQAGDGGTLTSALLAEVHSSLQVPLLLHLKAHKLRAAVTFKPLDLQCFLAPRGPIAVDNNSSSSSSQILLSTRDPRGTEYGTRILMSPGASPAAPVALPDEYERFRLLRGLPEPLDVLSRVPFECNLDKLNYISFSKGCYAGQELMARTKFRGTIRKRMQPYTLHHNDGAKLTTTPTLSPAVGTDVDSSSSTPSDDHSPPDSICETHGVGLAVFPCDGGKEGGVCDALVNTPSGVRQVTTFRPAYFNLT